MKRKSGRSYGRDVRKGRGFPVPCGLCSITSWPLNIRWHFDADFGSQSFIDDLKVLFSVSSTQADVQGQTSQGMLECRSHLDLCPSQEWSREFSQASLALMQESSGSGNCCCLPVACCTF